MLRPQYIMLEEGRSSVIRELVYDPRCEMLYLVFRSNGSIYGYQKVTAERYQALLRADSMGRFFTRQIKPVHDATSIDEAEWATLVAWARDLSTKERDQAFREKNAAWLEKLRDNPLAIRF